MLQFDRFLTNEYKYLNNTNPIHVCQTYWLTWPYINSRPKDAYTYNNALMIQHLSCEYICIFAWPKNIYMSCFAFVSLPGQRIFTCHVSHISAGKCLSKILVILQNYWQYSFIRSLYKSVQLCKTLNDVVVVIRLGNLSKLYYIHVYHIYRDVQYELPCVSTSKHVISSIT